MDRISFGFVFAGLLWSILTIVLTYGVWSARNRYWIRAVVCVLLSVPYPLMALIGFVVMNHLNTIQGKGSLPIYERHKNIESALNSDSLQIHAKSTISRFLARDSFVFKGKIVKYLNENGKHEEFIPDTSDFSLMTNLKASQRFEDILGAIGFYFIMVIPIGVGVGFLVPFNSGKKAA